MAEWRALTDPATESAVAHLKLGWWGEEIDRLAGGAPVHPITRFLAGLPGAAATDAASLRVTLEAAAATVGGVPLERADDLQRHATALYGTPLLIAASLSGVAADPVRLHRCVAALAMAQYLARALTDYRRDALVGRIPFAIDELLAAGIENDDLLAPQPGSRLQSLLNSLRSRAAGHFATAATALNPAERAPLRHLVVLAALGRRQLERSRNPAMADFRLGDLYNAWIAARRAAAAR